MSVTAAELSVTRVPELLSPAGDWEAMRAAVANAADAVYFGLSHFNARHRATNFQTDELPEIIRYLHAHNVKGFVTFNTLIFSDELEEAVAYTKAIAAAGADAVIVQDLGLARLIHRTAPTLPIHASTQMTLTEPRGIEFVRSLGVERVVAAREMSVADIAKIRAGTDMPLEVFIHGALCVAYSGQCLTSESLGGRSANRGQCAQACRLPYDLIVDGQQRDLGEKAYLLSPQDLAAYDVVADLAKLGVASLKIEGRLKSAHYVAATTQTYRQAIEAARDSARFLISEQQRADLEQTFSRGFTHGFLDGVNHQTLVAARFPKARGTKIGTVTEITRTGALIELAGAPASSGTALKPGDGVVFDEGHPEQDEQGGRVFRATPRGRRHLELELGRGDVNLAAIALGALVWKTDDPAVRRRLEHSFSRDTVTRRVPIDATVRAHVGERLVVRLTDGTDSAEATWDKPLETAQKFPVTEQVIREQLARLGDTPFDLRDLSLDLGGSPMVPKSVLNDLRRQAVTALLEHREARRPREIADDDALAALREDALAAPRDTTTTASRPALYVLVRTLDQLDAVLGWQSDLRPSMVYCDFENVRRYKDAVTKCRAAGMPIALATLRVVKPGEDGFLRQVSACEPDALLVRNLAAVRFYAEAAPHLPQIGDYALNIANELTATVFADAGLVRMVPSYDLNWKQLAGMLKRFPAAAFECVVHQHMPMFHMEHCVFAHVMSEGKDYRDCGRPCEKHEVDLRDHKGQVHPLIPDCGCRNTVFNAAAQSAMEYIPRMASLGVRHFRVELLREQPHEVGPLLDRYTNVILGRTEARTTLKSLRVLNQLGVTRGTLEHE